MIEVAFDRDRLLALRDRTTIVLDHWGVLRLNGPGALECLQGVFTNDVLGPGAWQLVYGAFLTPKGMIISDSWVVRLDEGALLFLPASSVEGMLVLFGRTLPPRLVRITDLRSECGIAWLYGTELDAVLRRAELGPVPTDPGAAASLQDLPGPLTLVRGTRPAPFEAVLVGDAGALEAAGKRVVAAGARIGTEDDMHAARIIAGWPALEHEIGERTLPQEVRFDRLEGLSHTKGCYTGQETVARLHFRGHTNKELHGLRLEAADRIERHTVLHGGKDVGGIHSALRFADRTLALATLRSSVSIGDTVAIDDHDAAVVALPFQPADLDS